jgi:hypothetical protein
MHQRILILLSFLCVNSKAQTTFYSHFGTAECLNEVWDAVELSNGNVLVALNKGNCLNQDANTVCEIFSFDKLGKSTLVKKWKSVADENENIGGIHKLADNTFCVVTKIENNSNFECHLGFYHFDSKFALLNQKRVLLDSVENFIILKSYYDPKFDKIYFSFNNQEENAYLGSINTQFNNFKVKKLDKIEYLLGTTLSTEGDRYLFSIGGVNYSIDTSFVNIKKLESSPSDYFNSEIKKFDSKRYITLSKEAFTYPPKFGALESDNISCKMVDKDMNVLKYTSLGKPRGIEDTLESVSYRGLSWKNPNKIYVTWSSVEDYDIGDPIENTNTWVALAQLDSNLNVKWTRFYFGERLNAALGLISTNDDGVLIYGRQSFDGEYSDGFVMKVNENGFSTKNNEIADNLQITISPNPCENYFDIAIGGEKSPEEYNLNIFDVLGQRIDYKKINFGINKINIENLIPATYFYTIKANEKIIKYGKVLKIK